jgi:hypothetical protein
MAHQGDQGQNGGGHDEDGSGNDRDDRTGGRAGLPPGIEKQNFIPPGLLMQELQQQVQHEHHETITSHTSIDLNSSSGTLLLRGNHITVTGQDGNVSIVGKQSSFDKITLGNGADIVGLQGNQNSVTLGNGNDVLAFKGNNNVGTLGNGNDRVTLGGRNNNVTVGTGSNTIELGHQSRGDTITVGTGTDRIASEGTGNTFSLDASASALFLSGTDNKVFINGGTADIADSATKLDHLVLNIGSLGGSVDITNFSAGHGVVDLAPDLGFATGAAAAAALTPDGHGGSLLMFAGGHGSLDLQGVAPSSLHASNFQIT